jgi:hypothetical protein
MSNAIQTEKGYTRPSTSAPRQSPFQAERRGGVLVARGTWLPTADGLAELVAGWDPDAQRLTGTRSA